VRTGVLSRAGLWALGGVLVAVLLVAFGWFLLISPQDSATSDLREQAAGAEHRVLVLQRRTNELRVQNEDLSRYKEQLAADRAALPTSSSTSDLLREVQLAGERTGVTVGGVTVGSATETAVGGSAMYVLPVSVTAQGNAEQLGRFLDQLQQVQPRAALITSATLDTVGARVNLALGFDVFVAGGSGSAAATTQRGNTQAPHE
jgi:Tfp pilus assembly protein PilO